jgi:hypothetical protein
VLNVAVAVALLVATRLPVPNVVVPEAKLTVPVGLPPYDGDTVTVAVNVTT